VRSVQKSHKMNSCKLFVKEGKVRRVGKNSTANNLSRPHVLFVYFLVISTGKILFNINGQSLCGDNTCTRLEHVKGVNQLVDTWRRGKGQR